MSDAGVAVLGGTDAPAENHAATPSEVGSKGSPRGSQRGSTVVSDTKDIPLDTPGESSRRRSLMAPSSGGNDSTSMASLEGAALGEDGRVSGNGGNGGSERGGESAAGEETGAQGHEEVIAWVKEHLVLPEFVPEKHWRADNEVSSYTVLHIPERVFLLELNKQWHLQE